MTRLATLLLTFSLVYSVAAVFITEPVSVNTSLNSTVTFTCEAEAVAIIFNVNGTYANIVIDKGFKEKSQMDVNATVVRRVLTVEARENNNNTKISCTAVPGDIESNIALLRIQGLLASVDNLRATILNGGSSVQLTWTAPHTLDSVPVIYSVDGQLVNATEAILNSTDSSVDRCTLNTAVVTAINGAGEGEPADVSFYYQTVPLATPDVFLKAVGDGRQFQVIICLARFCPGEYPSNITVDILDTNGVSQLSTSVSGEVIDNITIIVPDNLVVFIVNVSLSNSAGVFLPYSIFSFGGPVLNINSSLVNCSTVNISWDKPAVDEIVPILHYTLRIYDAVNGVLVSTVSIEGTSYQFEDHELFRHRYTYVIAAVNELGEGESANGTFSYQKAPQPLKKRNIESTQAWNGSAMELSFTFPVVLECTGEAPESVTVTVQCGITNVFNKTYPVAYVPHPDNITGSVPLIGSQCNLSIVFSNRAGHSDPLIIPLKDSPPSNSPGNTNRNTIIVVSVLLVLAVAVGVIPAAGAVRYRHKKQTNNVQSVATDNPDNYELVILQGVVAGATRDPDTSPKNDDYQTSAIQNTHHLEAVVTMEEHMQSK